ncbi:MAG: methyltransferase domain-containing protein [Desulfobacterales bacterium]|jgi:SAM-dependent methyltransferase
MKKISDDVLASMEFSASYRHNGILHTDCYYGHRVNLWRDILPRRIREDLHGKQSSDLVVSEAGPGTLVAARDERRIYQVRQRQITPLSPQVDPIQPRFGRFYPLGILNKVAGVYPNNMAPFRCVSANEDTIEADANHPLADKVITFKASIKDVREKFEEHGGTSIDWAETVLSGPGMQARVNGRPTHFFIDDPFHRTDESPDRRFYQQPRLVQHIDTTAIDTISRLYGRLLQPESKVLDLMSSWVSHLPQDLPLKSVTGLGMNNEELQANNRLSEYCVHDLNDNPHLPFEDKAFDAAICTVSVEYLVHPFDVYEEINRVLKPGGVFIVTFSNRWFPPKAIRIWSELHEFERMGLVLEFFLRSGQYANLQTHSMRGLPRPANDKYAPQMLYSDPVYAVWGYTRET